MVRIEGPSVNLGCSDNRTVEEHKMFILSRANKNYYAIQIFIRIHNHFEIKL